MALFLKVALDKPQDPARAAGGGSPAAMRYSGSSFVATHLGPPPRMAAAADGALAARKEEKYDAYHTAKRAYLDDQIQKENAVLAKEMKPEDKLPQQGGTRKYDAEEARRMRDKRKAQGRERRKKSAKSKAADVDIVEREVYSAKERRFKTMKVPADSTSIE